MALISLAIDYKKTPVEVRSAFALNHNISADLYDSIKKVDGVENVVFLSTCNRTEIYLVIKELRLIDKVVSWWQSNIKDTNYEIRRYFKVRQGTEVIKHLMKLSCGLESMVLGEPQILGQVKESYRQSKESDMLGKDLDRIFQKVFSTAKKVRRETLVGHCPVSVAFSAISLAKQQLNDISNKKVLIVGAGQTGQILFKHLNSLMPKHIFVANRTIEKAEKITANFENSSSISLDKMPNKLNECQIIVTAVNSDKYIINPDDINTYETKILIDISVPSVINPKIKNTKNIIYYSVDDIHLIIQENQSKREKEAKLASKIIEKSVSEYLIKERTIESNASIKELFDKADDLIDVILAKSLIKIKNGKNPEDVLNRFAYDIKKKVLHYPVNGMKQATQDGRDDCFICMKQMFGLNS